MSDFVSHFQKYLSFWFGLAVCVCVLFHSKWGEFIISTIYYLKIKNPALIISILLFLDKVKLGESNDGNR